MKRFWLKFVVLLVFIGGLLVACEVEPPTPDCELYGYGDVTVKNSTGFSLWVDCTKSIDGVNYEKKLYNGSSHTYYEMDDGRIYIWASFDGDDWVYDTYYLDACEDLSYTWYLDKKKSTAGGLYLEVRKEGELIKTVTDFTNIKR